MFTLTHAESIKTGHRAILTLTVIVPTFNEATVIAATLQRVQLAAAPSEILVADGCSTDQTAELARHFGTVLSLQLTRGTALNHAAHIATGDVLLFLHADTMLPDGGGAAIAAALRDAHVVGGAFRVQFDEPGRVAAFVAWNVNRRSSLLNTFFGDQAMFVRRDAFLRAGGFRDWSVMEDLEILARLRREGKLVLLDETVITSARRHRQNGWFATVVTVWVMTLLNRLGVPGQTMHRWYAPQR